MDRKTDKKILINEKTQDQLVALVLKGQKAITQKNKMTEREREKSRVRKKEKALNDKLNRVGFLHLIEPSELPFFRPPADYRSLSIGP